MRSVHLLFDESATTAEIAALLDDHGVPAKVLDTGGAIPMPDGMTILGHLKAAVGTMDGATARRLERTLPPPLISVDRPCAEVSSPAMTLHSLPAPPPGHAAALAGWGLNETRASLSPYTGAGVRLAFLDSGFLPPHPDFKGRQIMGTSLVPGEGPLDRIGHGTHCGAVACGPRLPTQYPRYGVAGSAEMWVLKVAAPHVTTEPAWLAAALETAIANRCDIVCMPIGWRVKPGVPYDPMWESLAQRAMAAGTLVMAATGNDSNRQAHLVWPVGGPANCPSVVAIGAVDARMRMANFSNGGHVDQNRIVDFVAPGVDIFSAHLAPALYQLMSGTSQAVAIAAGIAALHAEKTGKRGGALRDALMQTARALPLDPMDAGNGLVQAPM